MDEFDIIRLYFTREGDGGVITGVGDDGAVLRPDPGRDLVAVVDTLVESVHYPSDYDPADTGYRAVVVNLSDIAAMGARPRWMTLALTLADTDRDWLDGFAAGLWDAAAAHGVALVGGDTTSGPRNVISVQVIGDVTEGGALLRSGARPGDRLFVTGYAGDAAGGLRLIESGGDDTPAGAQLITRFRRPEPRLAFGAQAAGLASAAIDVSDGLVDDAGKLLAASGAGGVLRVEDVPVSDSLTAVFGPESATRLALTGGDDYELCLAVPAARAAALADAARELDLPLTEIGEVTDGDGLECRDRGRTVELARGGFRHFSSGGD